MAKKRLKTAVGFEDNDMNINGDSEEICPECGLELESGICPGCGYGSDELEENPENEPAAEDKDEI